MSRHGYRTEDLPDDEDEDVFEEQAPQGRLVVWMACLVAGGFAFARMIDADSEGKIVTLLVLLLVGIGSWTALSRPHEMPALMAAYVPFSLAYPFPIFDLPGLNASNVLLALGLIASLVSALTRPQHRLVIAFEGLLLVYMSLGAIGVLRSAMATGLLEPVRLAIEYRGWAGPILLFFMVRASIRDRKDAANLFTVIAWTTLLVAAVTWREGMELRNRGNMERQRVQGLMLQTNSMGAFLAYYGVPLLAVVVAKTGPLRRAAALFTFLVAARAILFTYSRGAQLALAVGSTALLGLWSPVGVVAIGSAAAGVYAVPQVLPTSVTARFAQTRGRSTVADESVEDALDKSSAARLNLWRGGAAMIREYPILGVGLRRFPHVVGQFTPIELGLGDPNDAHNAYILTAAELGLPALGILLALFVWVGASGVTSYRSERNSAEGVIALASVGCLAAVVVSCLFGSRFADEALVGGFWMLAGMVQAMRWLPPELEPEAEEE